MKKTIAFLTSAFALIGAAAVSSSCRPEEQKLPELNLMQTEVSVPAEGGNREVSYELKNAVSGTAVIAESGQEWVSDFSYDKENTICFTVAANEAEAARESVVTVSYGQVKKTFTVKQAGNEPGQQEPLVITIHEDEITESSVKVTVTPADDEMPYASMIIETKVYAEQVKDDTKLVEAVLAQYQGYADEMGLTLDQFLSAHILEYGEQTMEVPDIRHNTEYYFFSFGLSPEGEQLCKVVKEVFRTKDVEKIDMTFDIEYEVTGPDILMSVHPSRDDHQYFYELIAVADLEEQNMTPGEYLQWMVNEHISFGAQVGGLTPEEVVDAISNTGDASFLYDFLVADSDHVGVAAAINKNGVLCSEFTTKEVRSGKVDGSDNQLTISVGEVNADRAYYRVEPSNEDPYVIQIQPASYWEGMSDEEILEGLTEYDQSRYTKTGSYSGRAANLTPETEYCIYAFGYAGGTYTTGLFKAEFTTLPVADASGMTFEFTIENLTDTKADITVKGTPLAALYVWKNVSASATAEDVKAAIEKEFETYESWGYDRPTYFKFAGARGTDSYSYPLYPSSEYKVAAIGIQEETGEYATEVIFSETYRSLDPVIADLDVTMDYEHYFDGDEIAELYPEDYSGAAGSAFVPVNVTIDGEHNDFVCAIFEGDFSDTEEYTDLYLYGQVAQNGVWLKPYVEFYCPFDKDLTMLAYGRDKNGKYGHMFRKVIRLTKDGASDATLFQPNTVAPATEVLSRTAVPAPVADRLQIAGKPVQLEPRPAVAETPAAVCEPATIDRPVSRHRPFNLTGTGERQSGSRPVRIFRPAR